MKNNEEIINACYFCTTSFQLMTAILLGMQKDKEDADLYIVGKYADAEKYAEIIRKWKLFRSVVFVDENKIQRYRKYKNKFLARLGIALSYIRITKEAKKILLPNTMYKIIYISSKAFTGRLVQLYLNKKDKSVQTIYFDDGVGSYFNDKLLQPSNLDKVARKIFLRDSTSLTNNKFMLYFPELYFEMHTNYSDVEKIYISNNDMYEKWKEKVNLLFEFSEKDKIFEKAIIFDTIKHDIFNEEEIEQLILTYKFLDKYFENDLIIKKHPRDLSEDEPGKKYFKNSSIPIESIYMNVDIEDKILISVMSSAVVTPKIIFDKEPRVILLYKLIQPSKMPIDSVDSFFMHIKQIYTDSSKIFIPTTFEELRQYLESI